MWVPNARKRGIISTKHTWMSDSSSGKNRYLSSFKLNDKLWFLLTSIEGSDQPQNSSQGLDLLLSDCSHVWMARCLISTLKPSSISMPDHLYLETLLKAFVKQDVSQTKYKYELSVDESQGMAMVGSLDAFFCLFS